MKPTIEQIPTLSYEELVEQLRLSRINGADYRDISRALNAEMRLRTPSSQYRCFKCGHTACELIQVRTSGGFFQRRIQLAESALHSCGLRALQVHRVLSRQAQRLSAGRGFSDRRLVARTLLR